MAKMAAAAAAASSRSSVLFLFSLGLLLCLSEAQSAPPLVKGLSYTFYKSKCPDLESIIRNHLKQEFKKDIGLAAGLLRVHFHDCFVQVTTSSVLSVLNGQGG